MKRWLFPRFCFHKAHGWDGSPGTWRMWNFLFFSVTTYDNWVDYNGVLCNGWRLGWIPPRIKEGGVIPVICGRVKETRKMQEFYGA